MKNIIQKNFESNNFSNLIHLSPESTAFSQPPCDASHQPNPDSSFTPIIEIIGRIIPALQQDVLAELDMRQPQEFSELPAAKREEQAVKRLGYPRTKNADAMMKGGITTSVKNAIKSLEDALEWLT